MRDTIVETILATAILRWGLSEGLVTLIDVEKQLQHDHSPNSVDRGAAPIGSG